MRAEHGVPGDVAWTMAPRGTNTGEPIAAGDRARRGRPTTAALGWFCPGLEQPDGGGSFTLGFRSGLMVDADRPSLRQRVPALRPVRPGDGQGARADPVLVRLRRPRGRPAAGDRDARGRPGRAPGGRHLGQRRHARGAGRPRSAYPPTPGRDRRAVQRVRETGVDEDFGRGEDEYDTFFAGGTGPNKALTPVRPGAVLRRPVRALRPRHQGRAGHRRRRPGAARGRLADRGPLRSATPPRRSSARSTPGRAPRSARRWCSPRWPCGTCSG